MAETLLRHSIKLVAQRTGLSPHVIRAWEKRYGTVQPQRSEGNQRLYSEDDIQRLALLKEATSAGHSISNVTHLPVLQLRSLLTGMPGPAPERSSSHFRSAPAPSRNASQLVEGARDAVARLDSADLERILDEGAVSIGQNALLTQVIAPLVQRIGDEWHQGTLKICHEHLASAVIRTFLGHAARSMALHPSAPVLLATTPAGQLHDIGAALAAAAASHQGWRVLFMGACLPAEEIASAARQNNSRVVALSIVHPEDDPHLPEELRRLRRLLPATTRLVVGGRAIEAYRPTLSEIDATLFATLGEFSAALDLLRQGSN